ncbi:unnamed protein product [Clavelina lepadiformis]|uniref:Uncharacterized protein n=1 Tax=Clavelina lepadiformis TaxID=159417 RepID=A0ABP0FJ94_CLALP
MDKIASHLHLAVCSKRYLDKKTAVPRFNAFNREMNKWHNFLRNSSTSSTCTSSAIRKCRVGHNHDSPTQIGQRHSRQRFLISLQHELCNHLSYVDEKIRDVIIQHDPQAAVRYRCFLAKQGKRLILAAYLPSVSHSR